MQAARRILCLGEMMNIGGTRELRHSPEIGFRARMRQKTLRASPVPVGHVFLGTLYPSFAFLSSPPPFLARPPGSHTPFFFVFL